MSVFARWTHISCSRGTLLKNQINWKIGVPVSLRHLTTFILSLFCIFYSTSVSEFRASNKELPWRTFRLLPLRWGSNGSWTQRLGTFERLTDQPLGPGGDPRRGGRGVYHQWMQNSRHLERKTTRKLQTFQSSWPMRRHVIVRSILARYIVYIYDLFFFSSKNILLVGDMSQIYIIVNSFDAFHKY